MYDSLKRNGLSDTKHSLKMHLSSRKRTHKPSNNTFNKTFTNIQTSPFDLQSQTTQTDPLSLLIELLNKKAKTVCVHSEHERNLFKYACMDHQCPLRVGCSYCFLEDHATHRRQSLSACIKDLTDLKGDIEKSRQLSLDLLIRKQQEIEISLDRQFNQLKLAFAQQLDQLRAQINSTIQKEFTLQMDQIGKTQHTKSLSELTSEQKKELLSRICRMSVVHARQYVRNESRVANELVQYAGIYNQFLEEFSRALLQFFSNFSIAVPRFTSFSSPLPPPEILTPLDCP